MVFGHLRVAQEKSTWFSPFTRTTRSSSTSVPRIVDWISTCSRTGRVEFHTSQGGIGVGNRPARSHHDSSGKQQLLRGKACA